MNYNVSDNFMDKLSSDIDNKRLGYKVMLGGNIKDNKILLYTTDDRGKHSNFACRIFYGKLNGNVLIGKFGISRYVLTLLCILAFFCVESIVAAIISGSIQSAVFPVVIIAVEVIYLLSIKKISAENDMYIKKYLEDEIVED